MYKYSHIKDMGNNCGTKPMPDTRNLCLPSLGQVSSAMPNFCTLRGVGGDSYRNNYCSLMSIAGEWGNPKTVGTCQYNDCNNVQEFGGGCCDGCCGIAGGQLGCTRLQFTGQPIPCCLNDVACDPTINNYTPGCFSDSNQQNTCADGVPGPNGEYVPNYRSIVSTDCKAKLTEYCTGTLPTDNPNSTDWINRWTINNGGTGSCYNALIRNLFNVPNAGTGHCFNTDVILLPPGVCNITPQFPYDADGYFWGQALIEATMTRLQEQGINIGTLPGFPGYNPFQDFLQTNVCCPYPGLCQTGLDTICAQYTTQRISLNPAIASWCGCHLPPQEYQDYSVKFNIQPQCTPTCNRIGTIPIVGNDGLPILCTNNVCLIDDVTVNLVSSQIGGGLNFNQVCGNCGTNNQCSCIISDTTVDITNSTIGGSVIPIFEGCGTTTCTQTNPGTTGPATITVSCGTGSFNPYTQYQEQVAAQQAQAQKSSLLWTVLVIAIACALIYLIILFIHPNKLPPEGATLQQQTPTTIPPAYNPPYNPMTNMNNINQSTIQTTPVFNSILNR